MIYKTGEASISCSIPVHLDLTYTFANNPVKINDPENPRNIPQANAIVNLGFGPCGVTFTPWNTVENTQTNPAPVLQPRIYKAGYDVQIGAGAVSGASGDPTHRVVLINQTLGIGEEKTFSQTLHTALSFSAEVNNLIDVGGASYSIIDAPFPEILQLLQRLRVGGSISASCGGASVNGTIASSADAIQTIQFSVNAGAKDSATGTWSMEPPNTLGGFYIPEDATRPTSASDANGSTMASATSLTLSAANFKFVGGQTGSNLFREKTASLSGVVRAMEQSYPETLTGICSKFGGDPDPSFVIGGGGFGVSITQRRGTFGAVHYGATEVNLGNVSFNQFAPISCQITAASLEAVGEDLSPPPPPPDPETGVVDPFAEVGPPRATRLLMRGKRFPALGLALPLDFLVDDCAALNVGSGTFKGAWEANGSAGSPSHVTGGIRFVGSVKRTFAPDVSLSSYRYLRFQITATVDEGETPPKLKLQMAMGGKTFAVLRVGETDRYFVDLLAENDGPMVSAAGTKWPLKQRYFPIVSDTMPKYEKSRMGVGRCKEFTLSGGPAGVQIVVGRVELSRRGFYDTSGGVDVPPSGSQSAPPTVTFLPPFYRGKFIYEEGPDAPPTDLDRRWPTREFETRYFGDGYIQPPDDGSLREDLSGNVDEDDDYEDTQEDEDSKPDVPNKTYYWARRFLLAHVSGRQGLEEKDSSCQVTETIQTKTLSWGQESISSLVASINRINASGVIVNPGWVATRLKGAPTDDTCAVELPDFDTCYLNSDRPASWIRGAGVMAMGAGDTGGGWRYGFDLPLGDYDAQMLFDQIDWYPECGDFFGFGGSGNTLVLRAAAMLRGTAQGVVLNTKKRAATNKVVELRQGDPAPGALVSSGTSGADGFYKTSSGTFAKTTLVPATVKAVLSVAGSSVTQTFYGRKRQRVVLFVPADKEGNGTWISADIGPTGRHVRAYDKDDDSEMVMVGASNDFGVSVWSDAETVTGARPCVRYDASGNINLLFEQAGTITLLRSTSDGRTWTMPINVSNEGEFPALAVGATGLLYCFWRTEAGGIAGKILDGQGSVLYPATGALTVVSGGVAEDGIAAWCDALTRRVFVKYRDESGALLMVVSSDNGRTYA